MRDQIFPIVKKHYIHGNLTKKIQRQNFSEATFTEDALVELSDFFVG